MKIIILGNQARSVSIFWRVLIRHLLKADYEVVCCAPGGDAAADEALAAAGARVVHYSIERKGLNPMSDLRTLLELTRVFRREKPDIIFPTTIKPVIYGSLAARLCGVPFVFPTITGLGYVFEADSPLKIILKFIGSRMYRLAFAGAAAIFFQNRDDAALFQQNKIIPPGVPVLFANGTGVDATYFSPAPFPPYAEIIFLLVGRLLEAKGIYDYASAAALMKESGLKARFQLLGIPEHGKGSIPMRQIKDWQERGVLEYLGESRDVRPYIAASHVAVLPSWREGTPTSIMEAMAMGRPCVVTDVPGCREVVRNGVNGWLARPRDPASLAACMTKFVEDHALVAIMGAAGRKMALEVFDADKVAAGIIADMRQVMAKRGKDND